MTLVSPRTVDFPVLEREFNGHRLVYLDSAATSQTPSSVIDAINSYYCKSRASVHRGVYPLAVEATELYEAARVKVADFVGWDSRGTIFTRNATEAINLVSYAWGRANVGRGDLIVLTEMEHHSNLVPWQVLANEVGAELAYIPVDGDGLLQLDVLDDLLKREPKLVTVAHISNVLGTINPVAEITARAHKNGATVLIDGAQAAPHMPLDLTEINADFYVWTGHKAYGPTGVGVLHGRYDIFEEMPPFITGGHMISRVGLTESTWDETPAKFEAGTSPIAEAIGLAAAVDYLTELGMDEVWSHSREVTAYAHKRLTEQPGLRVLGPPADHARGSLCSFLLEGAHPHDVAEILGREGVCVRAGHHCALVLAAKLKIQSSSRASFGVYSTADDVDCLIEGLASVKRVLQL